MKLLGRLQQASFQLGIPTEMDFLFTSFSLLGLMEKQVTRCSHHNETFWCRSKRLLLPPAHKELRRDFTAAQHTAIKTSPGFSSEVL